MWYALDEHGEPVKANGAEVFGDPRRIIAQDEFGDSIRVSTVFLGLDHGFGDGPPVLWETMIFGGNHDQEQWRYSSRGDAVTGHAAAIALVLADP
jgi:hypothetical protein